MRWIPTEPACAECGFDWSEEREIAVAAVERLPTRLAGLAWPTGPDRPRTSAGWSATGYLWHLVDVLRIGTERLATLRLDPGAGLPCWDENALAGVRQYERLSAPAGLAVLPGVVGDWLGQARHTPPGACAVHPEFGELTALDIVRRSAHEAVHHSLDISRLAAGGERDH
jgi:hypothetical protein